MGQQQFHVLLHAFYVPYLLVILSLLLPFMDYCLTTWLISSTALSFHLFFFLFMNFLYPGYDKCFIKVFCMETQQVINGQHTGFSGMLCQQAKADFLGTARRQLDCICLNNIYVCVMRQANQNKCPSLVTSVILTPKSLKCFSHL